MIEVDGGDAGVVGITAGAFIYNLQFTYMYEFTITLLFLRRKTSIFPNEILCILLGI